MKVAIGHRIQHGPFGGGNRFVVALSAALHNAGHSVRYDLNDDTIDLILLTDPRSRSPNVSFAAGAILRYLARRNPNAIVVHRINECDERKGTKLMNWRLRTANYVADQTIFIATWLRDLPVWRHESDACIILNGADTRIFSSCGHIPWDGSAPLRLVTHHWGANRMKGLDVYESLDKMMATPKWRNRIAFTYIGNLPAGSHFTNAHHIGPIDGDKLADELRRHHAYVTGSRNEPAGMHHIEGALCGLPLLYHQSGALPEYCGSFGIGFTHENLESALTRLLKEYHRLHSAMTDYNRTADQMCAEYLAFFEDILARRNQIIAARRLWRDPVDFAVNQLPI